MRNKKKIGLIGLLAVTLCVGLASTLAYFTDSKTAENTLTMGNVSIELKEPKFEQNVDNKVFNVMPNATIDKDPTVSVDADSSDTYVRLVLNYEGLTQEQSAELQALIPLNAGWVIVDNYVYYNAKLSANDVVCAFDTVVIPNWGNDMKSKEFKINITAEAVQADYFTPTSDNAGNIVGWPQ